jgi:hypothetical protein
MQSRRMMSDELLSIERTPAPRFFAANQDTVVVIDRAFDRCTVCNLALTHFRMPALCSPCAPDLIGWPWR